MVYVPLSGTNVRLLSGVPFYNDYKETRWFDNLASQADYFWNRTVIHEINECNFQRIEGKSFIRVNKSIDALWSTNYLMFQNAQYNNKWFYGFVTKMEYVQKNSTDVYFDIDVLQTWRFQWAFNPSYVLREHCQQWNPDGGPVRNTVPEKLDYGDEYDNVYKIKYEANAGLKWLVIVANSSLHFEGVLGEYTVEPGDINGSTIGVPQPLYYYVLPYYLSGKGLSDNGDNWLADPNTLLTQIYTDTQSVNRVVAAYTTDYAGIKATITTGTEYNSIVCNGVGQTVELETIGTNATCYYVKEIERFEALKATLTADKYEGIEWVPETKLLMYPYLVGVLDDFRGNRIEFKLENIDHPGINLLVRGATGTSNKVSYGLCNYSDGSMGELEAGGPQYLSLEKAIIDNDPHDIPIINEYLAAYLQGHKNSITAQKNSSVFNGAMGVVSSGVSAAGAMASGNGLGIAAGGIGAVQSAGNTVLQLQSINAQMKDINNMPPQMAKMGSNIAYDYGNNYDGMYLIIKQIKPEYRKRLADFFKLYGYAVNELKVPNLHTRQYWNYVQTLGCNIQADINNEDLMMIRSIFDRGITLWHTNDIGNYNLANGVI